MIGSEEQLRKLEEKVSLGDINIASQVIYKLLSMEGVDTWSTLNSSTIQVNEFYSTNLLMAY